MEPRPIIALILYQVVFAALLLIGYNAHGWLALLIAWIIIIIASIIDTRGTVYKVIQVVVQTAWFIYLLLGIDPGEITLSFLKMIGK
jgi:hypothetical protein